MVLRRPERPLVTVIAVAAVFVLPVMLAAAPTPAPTAAPTATPISSPPPTPVAVHIKYMRFNPNVITITAGQTVEFDNDDKLGHTVTEVTGAWDSGTLDPGKTWQQTFVKAGTIEFLCGFHPSMRGKIIVITGAATPRPSATLSLTSTPAPSPSLLSRSPDD